MKGQDKYLLMPGVTGTSYNGHLEAFYAGTSQSSVLTTPPASPQVASDIRALLADAQRFAHDSGLD